MADNLVEIVVQLRDATAPEIKRLETNIRKSLDSAGQGFVNLKQGAQTTDGLTSSVNQLEAALKRKTSALSSSQSALKQQQAIVAALANTYRTTARDVQVASDAHSRGSRNILEYAAGYVTGRLAIDAFNASIRLIPGLLTDGLATIDRMKMSAASMAGAMLTNDPTMSFTEGLGRADAVIQKTFELSGRFVGNARELQVLAEAMTTFGFKINMVTKEGQDQFVTFGNILKLVTQGQNFEIQAFQELRALMMGQNFQGAMLARRLEAMGVNVKVMIPLWTEQGTIIENVVKILGGYEKASSAIYMTMEAQKRTLESMIQLTLAQGLKEVYADLVGFLLDINKALIGEDGKGGAAKSMGESIRDTYRGIKEDINDVKNVITLMIASYKEWKALLGPPGADQGTGMDKSPSERTWTQRAQRTWNATMFGAGTGAASTWFTGYGMALGAAGGGLVGGGVDIALQLRELAADDKKKYRQSKFEQNMDYEMLTALGGPPEGWPAETIAGRPKNPSESDEKQREKMLRELEKFEEDSAVRRLKIEDEFEGKKLEMIFKAGREALKLEEMINTALENKTITKSRHTELMSLVDETYQEAFSGAVDKADKEREEKIIASEEKIVAAVKQIREKTAKIPYDLGEGFRQFSDKYKSDVEGASTWLEGEERSINTWAAKMGKEIDTVFGEGTENAKRYRVELVGLKAELLQMAGTKATERTAADLELLQEQISDWRREAETPVKWPWNDTDQVKIMEGTIKAHEDYEKKLKSFRSTATAKGATGEDIEAGEKALWDRYQNAVKQVNEMNSTTMQATQTVWQGWFGGMQTAFTSFFEDALTGKLKSFKDYFQMFMDDLVKAWAKGLSQMVTKRLEMGMGEGAGVGFGEILNFLSGIIGLGAGGTTVKPDYYPGTNVGGGVIYTKDGGIYPGGWTPFKAFANGGIVSRPTLGLVGEGGGPEAVIPLKGGAVPVTMSGGSTKDVNVNFNIVTADTKDFDRLLMDRRSLIAGIIRSELSNASYMRDSIRRYA